MSNASQQSGFAIAFIVDDCRDVFDGCGRHIAHEDTGMAELRVGEEAQAAGAVLLIYCCDTLWRRTRRRIRAQVLRYNQSKANQRVTNRSYLPDSISLIRQGWSQARCARLVASSRSTMPGGMSS